VRWKMRQEEERSLIVFAYWAELCLQFGFRDLRGDKMISNN
jgi:hypothetical protein